MRVINEANALFATAQGNGLIYGRSAAAFAAASVYLVCRLQRLPHTIDEICDDVGIHIGDGQSKQSVENAYRILVNGLELTVPPHDPADFIAPIASALGLREVPVRRAHELMAHVVKAHQLHVGRDPKGVAGGVLRVLTAENDPAVEKEDVRNMQELLHATGRMQTTIAKMARLIRENVQAP